jgi:hypothetical protein
MTRQEVLTKIAYSFYERHKVKGDDPDPGRDWASAERVFNHFVEPARPGCPFWRCADEDYYQYARLMQDYLDSNPQLDQ